MMVCKTELTSATVLLVGVAALLSVHSAMAAPGDVPPDADWFAGVARKDITPREPLWLAGYAGRNRPAEGTLHRLWGKALALQDASGNRALLITCDILGFPRDFARRIRQRITADHGLADAEIILSASHTHSAPLIDNSLRCMYTFDDAEAQKLTDYADWLEKTLADLAGAALKNLTPAALYAGTGTCRFAVNRRNNTERELTPASTLQGPSDHAVPTLKVVNANGDLAAILFGYACHATVLDGYLWNGDYPGFAQEALEAQYPDTTALFFAGCGADQNPLPRRSIPLARQYGATLSAAVRRVLEEPMSPLEADLKTVYGEVELPLEPAPEAEVLRQRMEESAGYQHHCTRWLLEELERDGSLPTSYAYPIHIWRIGDQTLVALGGEVVVSYAIGIKEQYGQDTFVMGYANDLMGYIPSETILKEGGYEGRDAQLIYGLPGAWESGIEDRIYAKISALIRRLEE